jgi:DNA helicase II / ATP-dependent DNA helicase PcrA
MAVLYRSHFHALELQLELTRRNIPFSITSGIRFFEQAHIKDVAAYLKFIVNPRDETAFKRIVRLLPGVGTKAPTSSGTPSRPQYSSAAGAGLAVILEKITPSVPKKAVVDWEQFTETIAQLEEAGTGRAPPA